MAKRQRVEEDTDYAEVAHTDLVTSSAKFVQLENTTPPATLITCTLPPHPKPLSFTSYEAYDIHYAKVHSNRCSECNKNFPTEHFLKLHIAENHDPINQVKRARGDKIYKCFVEDCDKVCLEPFKRRLHLIDKHGFPRNYDFFIVNDGVDPRKGGSLLRSPRPQTSRAKSAAVDRADAESATETTARATDRDVSSSHSTDDDEEDRDSLVDDVQTEASQSEARRKEDDVDKLANSMSALKFVPPSIRFGRGGRGGLGKR